MNSRYIITGQIYAVFLSEIKVTVSEIETTLWNRSKTCFCFHLIDSRYETSIFRNMYLPAC